MKNNKYMTIKERREYMLNHDGEIPISFNPDIKLKNKSDRKYISTLVSGGDSSMIVKVKKGTRMLFGSGEHSSFGEVDNKKSKSKILTLFKNK